MNKRFVVLAIIVLVWALLACSIAQFRPERQARATSTPTRTPKPTFTATSTPTNTPVPSPTPTPSNTPTITPIATDTPLPTDTPTPTLTPTVTDTPLPTNTPLPPTATPRPTARPPARPTNTPVPQPTKPPPPPFTGKIIRGYPHSGGYAGVTGQVKHASGDPFADVAVGAWSDAWQGWVTTSEPNGKYEISLTNVPFGKYYVAVVRLETCGQRDGLPTAVDCRRLSNVVEITVTEDPNVNRVTEVDFIGP